MAKYINYFHCFWQKSLFEEILNIRKVIDLVVLNTESQVTLKMNLEFITSNLIFY